MSNVVTALYTPRPYQMPSFNALMEGKANRIITVWHRRAGKDLTAFNALWIYAAQNKGNYGYFFPFATQGRRAIWHGITSEDEESKATNFREFIPIELVDSMHDTEMRITLTNGSTIQFIGTDNIDAKMGSNFRGVVMSEYPLQDPRAWDLIEPILKMNGGWAWFPYTPRGKENHGYTLFEAGKRLQAMGQPWHVELLGINDTNIIQDGELDDLRERGVQEEFIQQEYYCNFGVSNFGAYFAHQMQELEEGGRINDVVAWNPNKPVHTAWDLGVRDSTCIWFIQEGDYDQWHAIDYHEDFNQGLLEYLKVLQGKPYHYGTHLVPHDAEQPDKLTGATFPEAAWEQGVDLTVVPRMAKATQIDGTHRMLPLMHFAKEMTEKGLSCLKNYTRDWDDKLKIFKDKPKHDWASHGADAFMTFVMGNRMIGNMRDDSKLPSGCSGDFDPRDF